MDRPTPTDSPGSQTLKIATWNLNHWQRTIDQREAAWAYLQDEAGIDIALLQETVPPKTIDRARVVYREIAGYRPWGSAVVALSDRVSIEEIYSVQTKYSRRRFTLANTFPGSVAIARVTIPDVQPITVVSVYNVIDGVYAQTTLLRIIADLIPLFDSADGSRVILGGDLNTSMAQKAGPDLERAAGILQALKGLGLRDLADEALTERPERWTECPCPVDDCGHYRTWREGQLDHLFVSPELVGQVRALQVRGHLVEERQLSDHSAVIATLHLDPAPVAHDWTAPAFIEEIRRRHGDDDARTVAYLVDWAEKKETALHAAGIRDRALTRLPVSSEIDPELWLQIDSPPKRAKQIQWTISIRATGEVVVQFRWMQHPPFDSEARRESLRQALNSIPGVDIPADRLNGRPTFPLQALRGDDARSTLLHVLDRLADETVFGVPASENAP